MQKKINVGLMFGGRSAEHQVSVMSAQALAKAICLKKYNLIPMAITKDGVWLNPQKSNQALIEGFIRGKNQEISLIRCGNKGWICSLHNQFESIPLDVLFPLLHGPLGEDGTIQGLCEFLGIPFVGSKVLASAVGMDKDFMKIIFKNNKIPQTAFFTVKIRDWRQNKNTIVANIVAKMNNNFFVKPAALGSSVGVSLVRDSAFLACAIDKAFFYGDKVIVEQAVKCRELECAVLGNDENIKVAGPGEVIYQGEFYDYDAKYTEGGAELIIPAAIDLQIAKQAKILALKAFQALECRGMARIDLFLTSEQQLLVNEVNTIPGFTPYSMFPKLWQTEGLSYQKLIDALIDLALS